jgi:hypothetical protein
MAFRFVHVDLVESVERQFQVGLRPVERRSGALLLAPQQRRADRRPDHAGDHGQEHQPGRQHRPAVAAHELAQSDMPREGGQASTGSSAR